MMTILSIVMRVVSMQKYAPTRVRYAAGVPNATSNDTTGVPAAAALASTADRVVLVLGTSLDWAREGHDATQINFTSAQKALLHATLAVAKNPITVLLMTAVPLDISVLQITIRSTESQSSSTRQN